MKNKNIFTRVATLGLPSDIPAHGTIGSLLAVVGLYLLAFLVPNYGWAFPVIVGLFALIIITYALPSFNKSDPGQICLDEVVGIIVTFTFAQLNLWNLIAGFALFRIFDISKILGLKYLERLPGAWGVVLDDVGAGVLAGLSLWALNLI